MDNFVYGVQALGSSIGATIEGLIQQPLLWGFGFGFLASTLIHLIVVTDIPHAIPLMITKDSVTVFQQLSPRDAKGAYLHSYIAFQKEHNRVRIAFYLALSTLFLVIFVALWRG